MAIKRRYAGRGAGDGLSMMRRSFLRTARFLMTSPCAATIGTGMFQDIRYKRSARSLLAAFFLLALALRIVVPAGFMPVQTAHGMVVSICDGIGSQKTMVIDVRRSDAGEHPSDHHGPPVPCAFAALSAPALAGGMPILLVAPGLLPREFALPPPKMAEPVRADFLTPPLRGPPALA